MIQALDCQWFSTRGHFPPRRTFINVWRHFWLSHLWGREGAIGTLVGRGQGYSECTGKLPQWRNFLAQMSVVPRLSNAGLSISHTAHAAVTFWIILTLFSWVFHSSFLIKFKDHCFVFIFKSEMLFGKFTGED